MLLVADSDGNACLRNLAGEPLASHALEVHPAGVFWSWWDELLLAQYASVDPSAAFAFVGEIYCVENFYDWFDFPEWEEFTNRSPDHAQYPFDDEEKAAD